MTKHHVSFFALCQKTVTSTKIKYIFVSIKKSITSTDKIPFYFLSVLIFFILYCIITWVFIITLANVADCITGSNDEGGVAHFVEENLL